MIQSPNIGIMMTIIETAAGITTSILDIPMMTGEAEGRIRCHPETVLI